MAYTIINENDEIAMTDHTCHIDREDVCDECLADDFEQAFERSLLEEEG
jgi:hypothetical protein